MIFNPNKKVHDVIEITKNTYDDEFRFTVYNYLYDENFSGGFKEYIVHRSMTREELYLLRIEIDALLGEEGCL